MVTVNPWSYAPSSVAAMIFLILFVFATIWHAVIMYRRRAWYFVVLVLGGCLEIVGYITRFLATLDNTSLVFVIVQTLCILVAPALFAASIYMVLGRLILLVRAEAYSPIRPTRLTKISVLGDLVSFIVQVLGSSMLSSNFSLAKTIILVGLIAQIICFGLFVLVAVLVWRRMARHPTPTAERLDAGSSSKGGWKGVMQVVFLTSALIFIRSLFRLIEFTGDKDAPMQKSEAYLYICDSTMMFLVLAVLAYLHPADYVPTRKEIMQIRDEELM